MESTRRKCSVCSVRIAKDANNPKRDYTEPVHTPHCASPTCTWCAACYAIKLAECKIAPRPTP